MAGLILSLFFAQTAADLSCFAAAEPVWATHRLDIREGDQVWRDESAQLDLLGRLFPLLDNDLHRAIASHWATCPDRAVRVFVALPYGQTPMRSLLLLAPQASCIQSPWLTDFTFVTAVDNWLVVSEPFVEATDSVRPLMLEPEQSAITACTVVDGLQAFDLAATTLEQFQRFPHSPATAR